jgi:hypothetical protein
VQKIKMRIISEKKADRFSDFMARNKIAIFLIKKVNARIR